MGNRGNKGVGGADQFFSLDFSNFVLSTSEKRILTVSHVKHEILDFLACCFFGPIIFVNFFLGWFYLSYFYLSGIGFLK